MISGETLRLLRILKGIKQETIAKKLGISQPAYCKMERCQKVNPVKYRQVIEALDCTKEELQEVVRITGIRKSA